MPRSPEEGGNTREIRKNTSPRILSQKNRSLEAMNCRSGWETKSIVRMLTKIYCFANYGLISRWIVWHGRGKYEIIVAKFYETRFKVGSWGKGRREGGVAPQTNCKFHAHAHCKYQLFEESRCAPVFEDSFECRSVSKPFFSLKKGGLHGRPDTFLSLIFFLIFKCFLLLLRLLHFVARLSPSLIAQVVFVSEAHNPLLLRVLASHFAYLSWCCLDPLLNN